MFGMANDLSYYEQRRSGQAGSVAQVFYLG
jgi:hypothetical protein